MLDVKRNLTTMTDFYEGDLESEFFQMVKSNWNLLSADKSTEVSGKKRRLDFIVSLKSHNVNVTQADVIENLSGVDVTIRSEEHTSELQSR